MSRRRLSINPLTSPTLNELEMQDNTSTAAAAAAVAVAPAPAPEPGKTSIHVTALDGIVNVNSLFTMSLFIGFSMTVPQNATTASSAACTTSAETVRRLIVFEVISFSFFLFSSLVAQSLKLQINLRNNMDPTDPHKGDIGIDHLKYCLFGSAVGSVLGCTFLTMSIVDFIRVKLGSLSCGGKPVYAVVTLLVFVGSGLLIYVITAARAAFIVQNEPPASTVEENVRA
ncbi:uncharacterized protein LOC131016755 [Salvia miltiorrhiza]|uniref:uncharacterized protein LOC131016755 n=1 Tax=Salvia miltiorrhiza TaxID=226208 RepID=UPI0025AD29DC|nr:uncharacterized protein LOC131016755 [Salvia miltiorrhiza]